MKKFELYVSEANEWFQTKLFQILQVNHEQVYVDTELEIVLSVGRRGHHIATSTYLHVPLLHWYKYTDKPLFLRPLIIEGGWSDGDTHSVLLAVKRAALGVVYFCLDSHGNNSKLASFYHNDLKNIIKDGLEFLEEGVTVNVEEVQIACPVLQTSFQGGNCVQWMSMMFAFLCTDPGLFEADRLNDFLQKVGENPNYNILLFTLSMFLRTMPYGPPEFLHKITYIHFHNAKQSLQRYANVRKECLEEDEMHRTGVFSITYTPELFCGYWDDHKSSMSDLRDDCRPPCRRSTVGNLCVNETLVKTVGDKVVPLDMHDIAERMFATYLDMRVNVLKNMTRRNKRFFAENARQQLADLMPPSKFVQRFMRGTMK
jgi:hypothetical protein